MNPSTGVLQTAVTQSKVAAWSVLGAGPKGDVAYITHLPETAPGQHCSIGVTTDPVLPFFDTVWGEEFCAPTDPQPVRSSANAVLSDGTLVYLCNQTPVLPPAVSVSSSSVSSSSEGPRRVGAPPRLAATFASVCVEDLGPLPNNTLVELVKAPQIVFLEGFAAVDPSQTLAVVSARNLTSKTDVLVAIDVVRPGVLIKWVMPMPGAWLPTTFPMIGDDHIFVTLEGIVVAVRSEDGTTTWMKQLKGSNASPISSDGQFAYFGQGGTVYALNMTDLDASTKLSTVVTFDQSLGEITSAIAAYRGMGASKTSLYIIVGVTVARVDWDHSFQVMTPSWEFQLSQFQSSLNSKDARFVGISLTGEYVVVTGTSTVQIAILLASTGTQVSGAYKFGAEAPPSSPGYFAGPAAVGSDGTLYTMSVEAQVPVATSATLISMRHVSSFSLEQVMVNITVSPAEDEADDHAYAVLEASFLPIPGSDWFHAFDNYSLTVTLTKTPTRPQRQATVFIPARSLTKDGYIANIRNLVEKVSDKASTVEVTWELSVSRTGSTITPARGLRNLAIPAGPPHKRHGPNKGATAAIVIVVLLLVAAIPAAAFYWRKRRAQSGVGYVTF